MTKKFTKTTAPKRSNWYGQVTALARNAVEFSSGRIVTQTFRLLPSGRVLVGIGLYNDSGRIENGRRILVDDTGYEARVDNTLFQVLQALLA